MLPPVMTRLEERSELLEQEMRWSMMKRRIAFVTPRFGAEIVGGAEAVVRDTALGLARRGWEVQVLTTCATSPYTWANELPEGLQEDSGLLVRRFLNILATSASEEHRVHGNIYYGQPTTLDEQVTWLNALFRTPGMFDALHRERNDFDAFVFAPYLFWNTTVCMPIVADRAVVMPCLHDETYAHLEVMRHVLSLPASVWFLSGPEHDLAHSLGPVTPQHSVIGSGLDIPKEYAPEEFREEYGIDEPFILYLGRREADKGWPWLLDVFASTKTRVKMVSAGSGHPDVPPRLRGRVIDVGYLTTEQRNSALAAAMAYVQPSLMESYSRTTMESWLAGRPVLVRRGSAVVEWHCSRSDGGLVFANSVELGKHLARFQNNPEAATEMGERGRAYVMENYQWSQVLDRMERDIMTFAKRPLSVYNSANRSNGATAPARSARSAQPGGD
jgi:glycosyltransferase involved in cell wall biosynthesis